MMDREKAVEYFKKMGYATLPNKFSRHVLEQKALAIHGDTLAVGDVQ
jgi:hypothetical protein